jgi:hypothetical protein
LREIAAASDFDFVAAEPRRAPKRRAGAKSARGKLPGWLRTIWAYRTPAIGALALFGLVGAILLNAMFLQRQRHPAPLLGSTIRIEPAKPAPAPVKPNSIAQILAAPEPSAAPMTPPPAAPVEAAPVVAAPAPAAALPAAPAKKGPDAIGALLGDSAPALPTKTILSAQKALQKLGAPVKPDGHYGASTRRAVEAFQRRHTLPVTGELTPRQRQLLAIESGLPVD